MNRRDVTIPEAQVSYAKLEGRMHRGQNASSRDQVLNHKIIKLTQNKARITVTSNKDFRGYCVFFTRE